MKRKYLTSIIVAGAAFLTACNSGDVRRNPGKIYAPDMVYSQAYDAFTENPVTANGLTSQEPVKYTIARGQALPDRLTEADLDEYLKMKIPYNFTKDEIAEGKRLYAIHCGICHGDKLDGQGPLFTSGKFISMPANFVSDNNLRLSEGSMYHSIVYGKNMMGSYASQLDTKQRWQVVAYIKQFQASKGGDPLVMGQATTDEVASSSDNQADDQEG